MGVVASLGMAAGIVEVLCEVGVEWDMVRDSL